MREDAHEHVLPAGNTHLIQPVLTPRFPPHGGETDQQRSQATCRIVTLIEKASRVIEGHIHPTMGPCHR